MTKVNPPPKSDCNKLLRQATRHWLLADTQRYQQAQNSLALFQHLQPAVLAATHEQGKDDKVWLELIAAKATIQLRRAGPAAQDLLQ